MCNVSSLAPCLEYLGIANPQETMQFEDYLWELAYEKSFGRPTDLGSRKKIAKEFDATIKEVYLQDANITKLKMY